jgi:hypothetical protein
MDIILRRLYQLSSLSLCMGACLVLTQLQIHAQEQPEKDIPDRFSMGFTVGNTYDPTGEIGFLLLTGSALYDYDKVWFHKAPDPMRFKVEVNVGGSLKSDRDLIASSGIFALYFLEPISGNGFKPYIEGGIGLIYTQHRVEEQGLHVNFNPQIGFGTEFLNGSEATYFAALRLHHISNAGLDDDNRGVNSIVFVFGKFLW